MSCDWTIKCVDCGTKAGFHDTRLGLMRRFIAQAPRIGEMFSRNGYEPRDVSKRFFVEHGKHKLAAVKMPVKPQRRERSA